MNCIVCNKELTKTQKKCCSKQCLGISSRSKNEKFCVVCRNKITTKGAKKFCSLKCRDKSYQKIVSFICEKCGKEVSGPTGRIHLKTRRFCSQDCVLAWKRIAYCGRKVKWVIVNCDYCKKELKERKPSKINKKNFCDKKCAYADKCNKMFNAPRSRKFKVILKDNSIVFVRSRWEAGFIKDFLEKQNLIWKYEPEIFTLSNGHKYSPDFYIENDDVWIEIKGYDYRGDSIERANIFRQDYGKNLIYADRKVLENIYNLNLNLNYLKTICKEATTEAC